jgi:hypothetical protein
LSFAVYKPEPKPEKPNKQSKTKQQSKKQTRQNKRKNKTNKKLPKMKILTFNGFICKVALEVKKPGKTEEKQMQEKIEKINQK